MTIQDLQLPIFASLFTGVAHFILQIVQMINDRAKADQTSRIEGLEESLKLTLSRIDTLEADNQRLHGEVNILREENATLHGLLSSQENKQEMIEKFLNKKI